MADDFPIFSSQDSRYKPSQGWYKAKRRFWKEKYGVYPETYAKLVSRDQMQWIKETIEKVPNFTVSVNPLNGNGVDFRVYEGDKLVVVGEGWNLRFYPRVSHRLRESRVDRTFRNLARYNCKRMLIVSCLSPFFKKKMQDRCKREGVEFIELGAFLCPSFYDCFTDAERQDHRVVKAYPIEIGQMLLYSIGG